MPSTILSDNGVSSGSAGLKTTASNDGILVLQTTTSGGTATNAVYIDTAQNVGLGVTPSAWSTFKGLQFVGGSLMSFSNAYADLFQNTYFDGSNLRYVNTGFASYYRQTSGVHSWNTAASGTAGNVITFTQAMTLNASGNLGIGKTSPTVPLSFADSAGTAGTANKISLYWAAGETYGLYGFGVSSGQLDYVTGGDHVFYSRSTNASTERVRIDSNGTFKNVATLNYGLSSAVTAAAGTATAVFVGRYSATAGDTGSGTNSFIVWSNGNVVNTNNSYGAISDVKLKENITDTTPKLEKLNQVRVVNYNIKGENQKQLGVIAQELEQVFPSMVDESPDKDANGNDLGTTTKSVKYSVFVPMLIKAIQELKAEFDAYKATHP
jgi:hypothetical protein